MVERRLMPTASTAARERESGQRLEARVTLGDAKRNVETGEKRRDALGN